MPDLLERLRSALADRYAVESEIGRGGMATVFLAEDLRHDRQVAIKVLHPELAASLGTDRFLREIKIAAGLDHPHILALHDSGEADGLLYFVMPYVEGESLRERLEREGQLPLDQALSIAVEVADGLAYAHDRDVVHRDIKPGNILLSDGHARIADFGVARALGVASAGEATLTGLAVGTPKYMSPEQASAGDVDGRADIYALGCVLWETLAGEPPWDAPTPQAILARKASETTPDLRVRRKSVPADVEAVIARAMAPAPADRFSTAEAFAKALKAPEFLGRAARRRRVLRRLAGVCAAIALLIAGILLVRFFTSTESTEGETVEVDPNVIAVLPFRVAGAGDALATVAGYIPDLFWMKATGEYGPRAVDPGSVRSLWMAAGGTTETPLSEAEAVAIAQTVGAGRLVHGVVAGTEARMSVTATLLEVPSGRVRVRQTTVEGPYEDYIALTERLINQLLVTDWGVTEESILELAAYDPLAVQAFLRGRQAFFRMDYVDSSQLFRDAMEQDSTFVLAAITAFKLGELDRRAARFAWDRRDQLSSRDRAELRGLAGWLFGATRTVVERVAQFDSIGLRDWETDVAFNLHTFGRLASIPEWRERSKAAFLHLRSIGSTPVIISRYLFEIAADEGDTAAMRITRRRWDDWLLSLRRLCRR